MDPLTGHNIPDPIFQVVRRCVAESLALSPDEVQLHSRLVDDLGADSLDFVDMVFMLDAELDVKMRETELAFLTRLDFASPEVMREGHLTAAVVDQLATWLPEVARAPDRSAISPAQLFSMITVESICIVASRWQRDTGEG